MDWINTCWLYISLKNKNIPHFFCHVYCLIGMTDMSYNIKCTFAEIFIFIRVIVQKYNLVYIVRILVEGQYGH